MARSFADQLGFGGLQAQDEDCIYSVEPLLRFGTLGMLNVRLCRLPLLGSGGLGLTAEAKFTPQACCRCPTNDKPPPLQPRTQVRKLPALSSLPSAPQLILATVTPPEANLPAASVAAGSSPNRSRASGNPVKSLLLELPGVMQFRNSLTTRASLGPNQKRGGSLACHAIFTPGVQGNSFGNQVEAPPRRIVGVPYRPEVCRGAGLLEG